MPEYKVDASLKKKNADGPLIIRDSLFGEKKKGENVLRGAVLIRSEKELFDMPIEKLERPTVGPLYADKKFLEVWNFNTFLTFRISSKRLKIFHLL